MERIGEYEIEELIGQGGMGKVYRACERLSGRRVALKVLRPELSRSEEARSLFINEMTILARLDHPNLVRSLACSEVEGELVMALEYLEGQTLRDRLSEGGSLPVAEAVAVAAQMARALRAAHEADSPTVHRDLKPENVMLLADGGVKVMDFGIAKVLEALDKTSTHSAGTLQYMSPEQIDATGVDARTDLYCLGLVLYEMLAGRPPFESASPRELLNLQCTAVPPSLPADVRRQLPRGIERLVFELLEKAPEDRPTSAADVLHELEPFLPSAMVESERASRPTSSRRRGDASSEAHGNSDDVADAEAGAPAQSAKRDSSRRAGPGSATPGSSRQSSSARGSSKGERSKRGRSKARRRGRAPVADTLALIERAASRREVPRWLGFTIVGVLTLGAALTTYVVRADSVAEADVDLAAAGGAAR